MGLYRNINVIALVFLFNQPAGSPLVSRPFASGSAHTNVMGGKSG
jgi:hypothetical protein